MSLSSCIPINFFLEIVTLLTDRISYFLIYVSKEIYTASLNKERIWRMHYFCVYLFFVLEVLNASRTRTDPCVSSYASPCVVAAREEVLPEPSLNWIFKKLLCCLQWIRKPPKQDSKIMNPPLVANSTENTWKSVWGPEHPSEIKIVHYHSALAYKICPYNLGWMCEIWRHFWLLPKV